VDAVTVFSCIFLHPVLFEIGYEPWAYKRFNWEELDDQVENEDEFSGDEDE
jgi:hypothetical protein